MDAPNYDIVWGAGVGMKPSFPEAGNDQVQPFQFTEAQSMFTEEDYGRILGLRFPGRAYPYLRFLAPPGGLRADPRCQPQDPFNGPMIPSWSV